MADWLAEKIDRAANAVIEIHFTWESWGGAGDR